MQRILVLSHHPALAALLLTAQTFDDHLVLVSEPSTEPLPDIQDECEEMTRLVEAAQWPQKALQEMVLTCRDYNPPPMPFDPPRPHGKAAQRRRAKGWQR